MRGGNDAKQTKQNINNQKSFYKKYKKCKKMCKRKVKKNPFLGWVQSRHPLSLFTKTPVSTIFLVSTGEHKTPIPIHVNQPHFSLFGTQKTPDTGFQRVGPIPPPKLHHPKYLTYPRSIHSKIKNVFLNVQKRLKKIPPACQHWEGNCEIGDGSHLCDMGGVEFSL